MMVTFICVGGKIVSLGLMTWFLRCESCSFLKKSFLAGDLILQFKLTFFFLAYE
uniref:Uncharacterized protein n=1 Tax=Rhizophora mucronata TaxID=61149 RepID=A0A2P2NM91_RHIMU